MVWQFAQFLARIMPRSGPEPLRVEVRMLVSVNGRKPQLFLDPNVDLAAEPYPFVRPRWLLQLHEPLPPIGQDFSSDPFGSAAYCEQLRQSVSSESETTGASAEPKPDVKDDFSAKSLLQFSQDVRLRNLFEIVVQSRLKNAYEQYAIAQRHRRGMRGDEFANDFFPRVDHFGFLKPVFQAQTLHELGQNVGRCLPTFARR